MNSREEAGGKLRVVFVSLDDDQRQLDDFLKAQPETGVRATYWLKEGKEREPGSSPPRRSRKIR